MRALQVAPFLLLPLAAIVVGIVLLFDFKGWRTAAMHPGVSYAEFVRERPSRKPIIYLIGGIFLTIGSVMFVGLFVGMVTLIQ